MHKFSDFNKLYTFSIVSKHLSFSKAAAEMFITQAAVSQQIRSLEQRLGFNLFHRLTREIALTQKGKILAKAVTESTNNIQVAIYQLKQEEESGILTVNTLPSFAMKWLIPRLEKFHQLYNDINIHISASVELADFNKQEIDMVIRFGYKPDDKMHAIKLMDEEIFLVASPNIITKNKPLNTYNDLKRHTIIHDEVDCHHWAYGIKSEIGWKEFSKFLNVNISKNHSLTLTQAHLVLQAAVEGQGVAIARSALVENELKSGALVKVFADKKIKSPGYHIIYPKNSQNNKKIKLFSDWLLSEAKIKK